ncbi:MAG: trimethylamine methyltransferase family protein [Candidatus Firestonebacteria bacterium]
MIAKVLTDEQLKKINNASLTILEKVGIHVPHEDMLKKFADSGAKVDFKSRIVKIPYSLVSKSIDSAQKKYVLYGRNLEKKAEFGYGKRNYNAIAGEALWVDEIGGDRRYTTMADVAAAARFCDALEYINIPGSMADPHGVDISWRSVEVLATMIRNTSKPVTLWFHNRTASKYIVDMIIGLRGSQKKAEDFPLTYPFLEPISPLKFPFNGIDLLYETARINMPVPIGPMAQMGMSAPGTLAATMAVENAEILAGVCITQLIRPGMPVCYGGICHAFDMKTTQMIFAGPEQAIFGTAMTQLGKFHGFPVYINVGLTDSKRPDAQAGLEAGVTLALGAAAGADIFGHMGICGVDQATSLDMLVLQNEIISYVESVQREVEISDDTLGLEVIAEAGPGGSFIDSMFTAEHFRKELWFPKLLDRDYYQAWLEKGALSTEQKVKTKKDDILKNYKPEPVTAEQEKVLSECVKAAKKDLGKE